MVSAMKIFARVARAARVSDLAPRALEPSKCDCLGLPPLPRLKIDHNSSCIVPYAVVRENDVGAATFVAVAAAGRPVTVAGPLAGLGLLLV